MKKRMIIFVIVIVSFVIIYTFGYKNRIINGDEVKIDMLTTNIPYSIRQTMSIGIRPKGIEKKYDKADVTRKLENQIYEIRSMDDGSKLFVIYNKDTNAVIDIWQLKKLLDQDDFQIIIAGKSNFNDILILDPYSTIIEKSKNEAISEHRLKNNKSVVIDYSKQNGKWIVKNLNIVDPDPSGFSNTISSEDMELIS